MEEKPLDIGDEICKNDFIFVKSIGSGAFGTVYEVFYDGKRFALKVANVRHNNALVTEIKIIRKLTKEEVSNVPKLFESGLCSNLEDRRFYTMTLYDTNASQFLTKNTIKSKTLFSLFFELIVTLKNFRKLDFRHRDIKSDNILIEITDKERSYVLDNGRDVIVNDLVHPIVADFNTSVFGGDDTKDLEIDARGVLEVVIEFYEKTTGSGFDEKIEEIISKFEDDDFSPEFLDLRANDIANILIPNLPQTF